MPAAFKKEDDNGPAYKQRSGAGVAENSERLDEAQRGAIPIASLSASLQAAFEQAHPLTACPVIDGQTCIQRADWIMFKARQMQDVLHRMRKRSLRLALGWALRRKIWIAPRFYPIGSPFWAPEC